MLRFSLPVNVEQKVANPIPEFKERDLQISSELATGNVCDFALPTCYPIEAAR